MLTAEQAEKLAKDVAHMRETFEARFSKEAREKEGEEMYQKLLAKIHPPKRKMRWTLDGKAPDEETKTHGLTTFMRAVRDGEKQFLGDMGVKSVMIEGTNSLGGFAVPEEFANEIVKLERENSIIRRIARNVPMGTLVRKVPRQLTHVTATWTDESVAATETNPTLEQPTQTAKKLAALAKFSNELLADNNVDLDRFVQEIIAEAIGLEEDRVAFAGNSGGGDPFDGVLYQTGVNTVTMAGGTIAFDDVINVPFAVGAPYRTGAQFVTSSAGLKAITKLKDSQGRYLWSPPTAGIPPSIWGIPYDLADQIPVNLGTGTDETALLYGNFKRHFWFSERQGLEVDASTSAADWVGGVLKSAFTMDETWFRFKKRLALTVMNPAAFAKLQLK